MDGKASCKSALQTHHDILTAQAPNLLTHTHVDEKGFSFPSQMAA